MKFVMMQVGMLSTVCLLGMSTMTFATTQVELGLHASNIVYTEPSVMREKGSLSGFNGRFIYQQAHDVKTLDLTISSGKMDYEGSGTIQDIPDELFEIRGLSGSPWRLDSEWQVTSYIGLGYRYLNDDSSGMVSSTNHHGYEREQIYYYIPIGIDFERKQFFSNWGLYGSVEFDYLILGKNTSYVGRLSGHQDLSFSQYNGHGNRLKLGVSKQIGKDVEIKLEVFYKYWNIDESTIDYDLDGTAMIEPKNHSKETGISLLLVI